MIDPFSAVVGTLQISGQCAQALSALTRYITSVATVDQRIRSFSEDVTKLRETYDTLQQCRNAPQMVAAAKAADQFTEQLWSHLAATLKDCENTLVAINYILSRINRPLGLGATIRQFVEPPIKQLLEQLYGGELGRHHEKIKMFNTSLALPMQMINITLQLRQTDLSERYQRKLDEKLGVMQATIDSLYAGIAQSKVTQPGRRPSSSAAPTLIDPRVSDNALYEHMEGFAYSATRFLSNASSVAASTRSGASTVYADATPAIPHRNPSEAGVPLTQRQRRHINDWVRPIPEDNYTSPDESEATPSPTTDDHEEDTDEEEFDLELVRTYFENGQTHLGQKNFEAAEENFVEALQLLQVNDFGDLLAFQSADVVLLLAQCQVEQNKLDEAIKLLLPLTEVDAGSEDGSRTRKSSHQPDHGRVLAAHHLLGALYMKKQDYLNSEKHGRCAFRGRSKMLGKEHDKTIESAKLMVDMYEASGKPARTEAYRKYLAPGTGEPRRLSDNGHRPSYHSSTGSGPGILVISDPLPAERPESMPNLTFRQPPSPRSMIARKPLPSPVENSPSTNASTNDTRSRLTPSISDDRSSMSSGTKISTLSDDSVTPRKYLRPRFDAVKNTAAHSKDKACKKAKELLEGYDPAPGKILIHRWHDIRDNIRKQGVEKGLGATGFGYAPIHFFCELQTEAVTEVELLIEDGADLMAPRYRAGYGKQEPMTPLQLAIDGGHQVIATMIVNALVANGVNISQIMTLRDREELSPLLAACRQSQVDTVTSLLQFGAAVNSGTTNGFPRFWYGNSLLHDACSRCDVEMVSFLLSIRTERNTHRSDIGTVDQQDRFRRTPLMYAVISKNIPDQPKRDKKVRSRYRCVEILLQHAPDRLGQSLCIRDTQGMDVYAYAKEEQDQALVELLERYGAYERDAL